MLVDDMSHGCTAFSVCAHKHTGAAACWGNGDFGVTVPPEYDGVPFLQVTTGRTWSCGMKVRGSGMQFLGVVLLHGAHGAPCLPWVLVYSVLAMGVGVLRACHGCWCRRFDARIVCCSFLLWWCVSCPVLWVRWRDPQHRSPACCSAGATPRSTMWPLYDSTHVIVCARLVDVLFVCASLGNLVLRVYGALSCHVGVGATGCAGTAIH